MLKPYRRAELQFEEVREIGADGRNSTTWVVNDVQLGAQIVVKTIPKADIGDVQAYFSEAKALYTTSHQNVVQIHYACEDLNNIYIAMPLYQNGSIKSYMHGRFLTVREVVRLGCQMLSGLHNIHSKGLIHFDIKPDNILLSNRNEALVSDFGLAKVMWQGLAEPDKLYPKMVPPEVVRGGPFDVRFDIYQVGLTLYRMVVGNEAFDAQRAQFFDQAGVFDRVRFARALLAGEFPDRKAFDEHVPSKLRKVIVDCLEPDPNDRYQSALAVANALAEVCDKLDWRLEKAAGRKIWSRNESGTTRRFVVNADGSTEFTTTAAGGAPRRKTALCKQAMNRRDIERVLKDN